MRPEYPIECRCSHRQVRFRLGFARHAAELLPRTEDTICEPESRGATDAGAEATAHLEVTRATGTLAALLGFSRRLEEPADGRTRYTSWPIHCA